MIVGPLLARFGKGYIPKPGGDKIGRRRLDTHFIGFEKLGAKFIFDSKSSFYRAEAKKLKGTYMLLDEASVTGTATCCNGSGFSRRSYDHLQCSVRTIFATAVQDAESNGGQYHWSWL